MIAALRAHCLPSGVGAGSGAHCCTSAPPGVSLNAQAVRAQRKFAVKAETTSTDGSTVDVDKVVKDLQDKVRARAGRECRQGEACPM